MKTYLLIALLTAQTDTDALRARIAILAALQPSPAVSEPLQSSVALIPYKPTQWVQRLAVQDNRPLRLWYTTTQDEAWVNAAAADKVNPNRVAPIAVPGGLHSVTGWRSMTAAHIPGEIAIWNEPAQVFRGSPVVKTRWAYPVGTVFSETLVNSATGETFEIRVREKVSRDTWRSSVTMRNVDARPVGYTGAGQTCISCHQDAGASKQYGILWRGDDGCFSFNPIKEHEKWKTTTSTITISQSPTMYAQARHQSTTSGKPLLVVFSMTGCAPCRELDSKLKTMDLSRFVVLKLDGPSNPAISGPLGVRAYPTTVIAAPDGTILKTVTGVQGAMEAVR